MEKILEAIREQLIVTEKEVEHVEGVLKDLKSTQRSVTNSRASFAGQAKFAAVVRELDVQVKEIEAEITYVEGVRKELKATRSKLERAFKDFSQPTPAPDTVPQETLDAAAKATEEAAAKAEAEAAAAQQAAAAEGKGKGKGKQAESAGV